MKEKKIARDRATLEHLLANRSKIRVLRLLLENHRELTGREMSRLTGLDHKTCNKTLKEFCLLGVVRMAQANHSNLYRLNSKNYLVNNVILPLFEIERKVLNGNGKGQGTSSPSTELRASKGQGNGNGYK